MITWDCLLKARVGGAEIALQVPCSAILSIVVIARISYVAGGMETEQKELSCRYGGTIGGYHSYIYIFIMGDDYPIWNRILRIYIVVYRSYLVIVGTKICKIVAGMAWGLDELLVCLKLEYCFPLRMKPFCV